MFANFCKFAKVFTNFCKFAKVFRPFILFYFTRETRLKVMAKIFI